jgi:hypothetical protein
MRAKFQIQSVERFQGGEKLKLNAVGRSGAYPSDGHDEDNTYASYTPSASCEIYIANSALFGCFEPGQKFYVDFTPVD